MTKTILLAGVPEYDAWSEEDLTVEEWLAPFVLFLDPSTPLRNSETSNAPNLDLYTPSANGPTWRVVPIVSSHLPTGWSQRGWLREAFVGAHHDGEEETSFLPDSSPIFGRSIDTFHDSEADGGEQLSQFIEHSFALHEDAHSSQITTAEAQTPHPRSRHRQISIPNAVTPHATHDEEDDLDTSLATPAFLADTPTTFASTFRTPFSHATSSPFPQTPTTPTLLTAPQLYNLASLPSATYLSRIEPQTITVDLIVGIISSPATRTVTVRRSGRRVDVTELLVGDETRTGFVISFWLGGTDDESQSVAGLVARGARAADDTMRMTLRRFRAGDVVLLRNVALKHFRKIVMGQSLGKRAGARCETVARLVWRAGLSRRAVGKRGGVAMEEEEDDAVYESDDLEHVAGGGAVLAKVARVREWTRRFVQPAGAATITQYGGDRGSKRARLAAQDDLPPDDTQ